MKAPSIKPVRCAIYTRVSTEHGLDQEFNSLDAQHEAASAYIKSQAHAGWTLIRSRYDDGGYSGGSTDRPDLQRLLNDIRARKIDVIVVYKVDRLTRSLADFAKLVELFDAHGVSFVSVTQQFNTTTSMGRLTLNVLLSFAQFEREGEEGCDGFASPRGGASRCNSPFEGMWPLEPRPRSIYFFGGAKIRLRSFAMTSRSILALLSIAFGIAVILAAVTSIKYPPLNDYDRAALTRHNSPRTSRQSTLDVRSLESRPRPIKFLAGIESA